MSSVQQSPATDQIGRGVALRICAAGAFSVMAALLKLSAADGVTAPEMVFYRALFGLPVVVAWVLMTRGGVRGAIQALTPNNPWAHILRSVIGVSSIFCVFQALSLLPLADATTLSFTAPIFATILSFLLLKEQVGVRRWAAVAVGFVGVLIVTRPLDGLLSGSGEHALPIAGIAIGLLAALLTAGVAITLRQLGRTEHVAAIVFWFFVACSAVGALTLPVFGRMHEPATFALLIGAGVAGGSAQLFMTSSLQNAPVSVVAPFDYLQIVGAVVFGWWLLHTPPTVSTLTGAALITAGGLYPAWREHLRRRQSLIQPTAPPV